MSPQSLDEPAARQSDPTVLTLQLRQLSKEAPGAKSDMVGRIEHADEHKAKKIQQWIGEAGGRMWTCKGVWLTTGRTACSVERFCGA